MPATALLQRHLELCNLGVREGHFAAFVDLFCGDAVMRLAGVPIGPLDGRDEIAEAYRRQPPDDTMRLLRSRVAAGPILAEFAWERTPDRRGGDVILIPRGVRIGALAAVYGGDGRAWR